MPSWMTRSLSWRPSAFFDFDDTLIEGDSILYWMSFYYRRRPWRRFFRVFNLIGLLLYVLRVIDGATLKRIFFIPMCYESEETLERLAREFARRELVNYFYPHILERLLTHRELGHRVIVVSASAQFYLKYLEDLLPSCHFIGNRFEFPRKSPVRLPKILGGNVKGAYKLQALTTCQGLPKTGVGCFGYSDHHSDRFPCEFTAFEFLVYRDYLPLRSLSPNDAALRAFSIARTKRRPRPCNNVSCRKVISSI